MRVNIEDTLKLRRHYDNWLEAIVDIASENSPAFFGFFDFKPSGEYLHDPKLHVVEMHDRIKVVFRQVNIVLR